MLEPRKLDYETPRPRRKRPLDEKAVVALVGIAEGVAAVAFAVMGAVWIARGVDIDGPGEGNPWGGFVLCVVAAGLALLSWRCCKIGFYRPDPEKVIRRRR
jgi:hypothetical protein